MEDDPFLFPATDIIPSVHLRAMAIAEAYAVCGLLCLLSLVGAVDRRQGILSSTSFSR